jgi:hypothetical protein
MGGNPLNPLAAEVAEAVAREVTTFNHHTSRADSAAVGVEDKDVPDISDAFLGPRIAVLVSKVLEESLSPHTPEGTALRIALITRLVLEPIGGWEETLTTANAAAILDVSCQYASMLRDAGKLGEVVTTGEGQCHIRWSGLHAHIAARAKQHECAAWRLQTGMDARVYAFPEGAQLIVAPTSMLSGLGRAACE